ncbi:ABC transporter permease [Lentibacillus sediminis]|uniref:ABC transporter permease n=1 Tax=Lentibacillus sediminis TaxID=1940529 RepID=UPI000C1C0D3A|nr:ABC transporter permease [Lentibacillus sediminis]
MNVQRISAIFEKDLKDFMKNMMLLTMPAIPIVLGLLYQRIGGDEELPLALLYLIVGVTFSSVTSTMIMTMMAEENEKNTLRGLIQSPASMFDIIVGKSLVTALLTLITLVISLAIIGAEPFMNVRAIIGLVLLFLFFLLLGIGVGLFAKSVASTSVYMMPIMFLFGFTPMVYSLGLDPDSIAIQIFDTFPIPQLLEMHDTNSWLPLAVVGAWVAGAALFVFVCFKKTQTDD